MKNKLIVFAVAGLIFCLNACNNDNEVTPNTPIDNARFDALMANFIERNSQLYGAVASIEQPNRISWQGAVGNADLANQQIAKINHQFMVASITKTFVATVVLQLVEEGKLELDDTIDKYLTAEIVNNISIINGQSRGAEITIRQLLSHKSGIYDYLEAGTLHIEGLATPDRRYSNEDRIRYAIENGSSYFAPNEGFAYSNTNFVLLELVIESATGQSLNTHLVSKIFQPLNLINTHFAFQEADIQNLMQGYFEDDNITNYITNFDWASPDGGIISNTRDIQRFARALFGGELFQTPQTLQKMLTFENGYGLGIELIVDDAQLGKIYGHSGATPGYTSIMAYVENLDATIVISGNQTEQYLDDGSYLINQFIFTLFE